MHTMGFANASRSHLSVEPVESVLIDLDGAAQLLDVEVDPPGELVARDGALVHQPVVHFPA